MPGPTDQYDMPAQRARADREQRARLDTRAWQLRQDAAISRNSIPVSTYVPPQATNTQPVYGYPPPPPPQPEPMALRYRVLWGFAFGVFAITVLAFYTVPLIKSYFANTHFIVHAAAAGIAGYAIGMATMLVLATALGIIDYIRAHPIICAMISGLGIFLWIRYIR